MYLYPKDKEKRRPLLIVGRVKNKNSPKGIYDSDILCGDCDTFIGGYDKYGKIVFQDSDLELFEGSGIAFFIKDVDFKKLSLFILSVLWRCSITSREEFMNTELGPYEKKIWKILTLAKEGENFDAELAEFDFVVARFGYGSIPDLADRNMQLPMPHRIDSINFHALYLPRGYKIYIKVDKRELQESLKKVQVGNKDLLIVSLDDFENSHEFEYMREVVRKKPKK